MRSTDVPSTASNDFRSDPEPLPLPGITLRDGFRLRRGQAQFLGKLAAAFERGEVNHLGVFVPGYGKTITALASFVIAHHLGLARKLVVFVPRGNLRDQYADPEELGRVFRSLGAPPFSFCVADSERVFLKNLRTQIIVTTYQYASGDGGHAALLAYCRSAPCMFVFDEVHHLSEDGTWAAKIEQFPHACSVALSGTPLRSDNKTLFGVPFEQDAEGNQFYVALHEVTLRDAHAEGQILKHVDAHVVDYRLRMVRHDTGEEVEMTLSAMMEIAESRQEVDAFLARKKLRFHEVYLENLLGPAFARFAEKRAALRARMLARGRLGYRDHQMLVIAMSNRHAEAMLDFIRRRFPDYSAGRIGQDVGPYERAVLLNDYRDGRLDVMVQVDMIGEGTDIKPISVIVKADLVRAYSKTLQQVFRGMRYHAEWGDEDNRCDLYAANDSDVVHTLEWIAAEEQVGIKMKQERQARAGAAPAAPSEHSVWELKEVEHRKMRTHSLEQLAGYARTARDEREPQVVDVGQREKDLRKACAALAAELTFVLQGDGRPVDVRVIHAEAKRRFARAQKDLSVQELAQKRDWLEKCIRARRLL